ncbi:MAG: hypothetical protein CM15mP46_7180 [Alphaproteobacteria bacterium]|nr:MAG: hypothetical protein CM15mP46_7180 [Alphaproteobacteria bacterium]
MALPDDATLIDYINSCPHPPRPSDIPVLSIWMLIYGQRFGGVADLAQTGQLNAPHQRPAAQAAPLQKSAY